ncbi:hypothetical protein CAPTEDRAFT_201949 [Capitella teleta]|uniref:CARD domain-containing protein n=1 Tax=Capitella teleta TaxID=283909 RepID=R7TJU9_CAPTE|nr:hypothetical protein CAPTEDRAFT_201949 [Capitella teleta]|eukprot:ELT91370.1 hypothetical protein CAPTEDRAFT_201949 [Capitella teleta]
MALSGERKEILNDKRVELVESIQLHGLWSHLRSRRIVTKKDEDLIKLNRTPVEQVGEFLDHLARRTNRDYEEFCECLEKDNQGYVVTQILGGLPQKAAKSRQESKGVFGRFMDMMWCKRLPQHATDSQATDPIEMDSQAVKDARTLLKRCYSRLRDISTAPWACEFDLDSADVYISLHLKEENILTSQKRDFTQDQIFTSLRMKRTDEARRMVDKNPKRILLEGDPGMGKSTLCQSLTYRWAYEICNARYCKYTPCIHSWSLVIYLTAPDYKGYTDIATAVCDNLLPEMTANEAFEEALEQSSTLFIVDSYDEGHTDNTLLQDLIKGIVCAEATVLVTSRPNYLRDMLRDFDSNLFTGGFNGEQKRLYVKRFARCTKQKEKKFRRLLDDKTEIASLCSNPLNLSILCMLITTEENQRIETRSELYSSVHTFLMKKASERMRRPLEQIEADIIRPLCQLSFDAYERNTVFLSNADLTTTSANAEDFCQSGYLTRKFRVSLINPAEERFVYSHKTFQEFLAARHVAEDIYDWLKAMDAEQWLQRQSFISFMLDWLPGGSMVDVLFIIVEKFAFSQEKKYFFNFPASCLLLNLLSHLKARAVILSPEMEDEIRKKSLLIINRTVECSPDHSFDYYPIHPDVIITFDTICKNMQSQHIAVNTDIEMESIGEYLIKLEECEGIRCLKIECKDDIFACRTWDAIQRGHQGSFFSFAADQLTRGNVPLASYKEDSNDFLRLALEQCLGKDVRGLEFCDSSWNRESVLRAVENKPLTTLKIEPLAFNHICSEILVQLCSNPQLKILHIPGVDSAHRTQLLSQLSHLDALDELYLFVNDVNSMSSQDILFYEQILKKNKMWKLTINAISDELSSVLCSTIPTMTSLKKLKLHDGRFNFWIPADDQLQLQSFHLSSVSLNLESFINLCELIAKWKSLTTLKLSEIEIAGDDPESIHLRQLFAAIANCQRLNKLSLDGMEIGDDVEDQLSQMLQSLQQLEHLDLWTNNLSPRVKGRIEQFEQQRERRFDIDPFGPYYDPYYVNAVVGCS